MLRCVRCALASPRRVAAVGERVGRARVCAWRRLASASADVPDVVPEGAKLTLTENVTASIEVKKSKFVAVAGAVDDPASALRFVADVSDPSASHNCYAYKIGNTFRFSDDGEPGGTGGRPIFSALESTDFENVCVVVTRYYGGTQLGTGGLIRAYGGCAVKCLQEGLKFAVEKTETVDAMITAPSPDHLGQIYRAIEKHDATSEDEEFPEDGSVFVQVLIEKSGCDGLADTLRELTNGKATLRVLDD
jgi:uncharacterized YigZ family protein